MIESVTSRVDLTSLDPLAIPLVRIRFEVELKRPAGFRFIHTGAISGLLRAAIGAHELHPGVLPVAPESGRVRVEAGERYAFGVTLVGDAVSLADRIVTGVARIGRSRDRKPLALHGNFDLCETARMDAPEWAEELTPWYAERAALTLRLVSPLRLSRPAKEVKKSAGYFNDDYFPLDGFLSRVATRLIALVTGRPPSHDERRRLSPVIPEGATLSHGHLVWVDMPIGQLERSDPTREHGYTKGGVVGRLELHGLNDAWLHWLAVASETGIGESTRFGLGRFRRGAAHPVSDWCAPASTMLERMLHPAELRAAASHFGDDAEAILDEISDAEVEGEHTVTNAMRDGSYEAEELGGFLRPKDARRVRALAVPTVRERLLQRAAAAQLTPAVDALFEECSFAYRKGLSYRTAAQEVARAQREGFEWVLDADISSFFDHVDWDRLRDKLEGLLPHDPLVRYLMSWISAPVRFDGRLIERNRGVPQGAVISPVLANLYLDELDEALMGENFRLVRYADDFVVLCRDLAGAQAARDAARSALERLQLQLHEDKSRITSFDDGFSYLGHLFVRSAMVERARDGGRTRDVDPTLLTPEGLPAGSWLTQVPFEDVKRVALDQAARRRKKGDPQRAEESGALSTRGRRAIGTREAAAVAAPEPPRPPRSPSAPPDAIATNQGTNRAPVMSDAPSTAERPIPRAMDGDRRDRDAQKRPVHIVDEHARLRLRAGVLQIERKGALPVEVPLQAISHLTVLGAARLTVPLLLALSDVGVPVFFCRRSGALRLAVHHVPDWSLWRAQLRATDDSAKRLAFAKRQVRAKLRNSAAMIVKHDVVRGAEVAAHLRALGDSLDSLQTLDEVRGKEGAGAARVFEALRETLAPEWGFTGRNRNPPRDPVNAMLSFGYGMLYRHVTTALVAAGLNPRLGLMHEGVGRHAALASDVVEEYRYLIDGLLLAMLARRELRPELFESHGDAGCRLTADGRRSVVRAVEQRLLMEFTAPGGERPTYRMQMDLQAGRLAWYLSGTGKEYLPHQAD